MINQSTPFTGAAVVVQFFPGHKHLDYAITVEEYTLAKAANLVLNVDGCIAALFLDLLYSSGCFSQKEMDDIIAVGYLNGLFVLARSIGLIGHALDQKRLQQPLYRHPWEVGLGVIWPLRVCSRAAWISWHCCIILQPRRYVCLPLVFFSLSEVPFAAEFPRGKFNNTSGSHT